MNDLDPAATRANETGWSKDALAAEKARKKAEKKKAGKERWAARWRAVLGGAYTVWDFFLGNLMLWVSIAGCLAIGAWEWLNTSRGWHVLYPGIPPAATYVGAIGAVVAYFASFWRWRETARSATAAFKAAYDSAIAKGQDPKTAEDAGDDAGQPLRNRTIVWLTVTVAAYLVCVTG